MVCPIEPPEVHKENFLFHTYPVQPLHLDELYQLAYLHQKR